MWIRTPQSSLIMSDAFSAIMTTGACVCEAGMRGITDASAILRRWTPWTCNLGDTTPDGSPAGAILHVPTCGSEYVEYKADNFESTSTDVLFTYGS